MLAASPARRQPASAHSVPLGQGLTPTLFSAVTQKEKPAVQWEPSTPHTVKLRGAPFNVTEVRAANWDKGQS